MFLNAEVVPPLTKDEVTMAVSSEENAEVFVSKFKVILLWNYTINSHQLFSKWNRQ